MRKLPRIINELIAEGKSLTEIYHKITHLAYYDTLLQAEINGHRTTLMRYIKGKIYEYNHRDRAIVERCKCQGCNDSFPVSKIEIYINEQGVKDNYCQRCFNRRYIRCCDCHWAIWSSSAHTFDGKSYCGACYDEVSLIREGSYDPPKFQFSRLSWEKTVYMGIELEVIYNGEGDLERAAKRFKDYLTGLNSNAIYLKYDGSLDNGFEIVTHPTTLQAMRNIKFYKMLSWLDKNNFSSYDGGTCGMHIHIGIEGIGKKNIPKMRLFFKICSSHLDKISNRKGKNLSYCRYESDSTKEEIYDMERQEGRYWALNLNTDKPTIEVRIFRGTLNYKRFLSNLTVTDAIANFCQERSIAYFMHVTQNKLWGDFTQYIKSNNNQLYKYYVKGEICA